MFTLHNSGSSFVSPVSVLVGAMSWRWMHWAPGCSLTDPPSVSISIRLSVSPPVIESQCSVSACLLWVTAGDRGGSHWGVPPPKVSQLLPRQPHTPWEGRRGWERGVGGSACAGPRHLPPPTKYTPEPGHPVLQKTTPPSLYPSGMVRECTSGAGSGAGPGITLG